MADIDVERKGPNIWPWVIGLLVLALLIWAIAEMVDTDEPVAVEEPVEEVTEPPAAVPEPEAVEPEAEMDIAGIETLLPLEEGDVGRTVRVSGEIVGQVTESGFWVRLETPEPEVLWVQAPTLTDAEEPTTMELAPGEAVDLVGSVRRIPEGEVSGLIETAGLRDESGFEQWNVHREFMVTYQPEPGPIPGDTAMRRDTIDGRY